jgi:hypothetical protein
MIIVMMMLPMNGFCDTSSSVGGGNDVGSATLEHIPLCLLLLQKPQMANKSKFELELCSKTESSSSSSSSSSSWIRSFYCLLQLQMQTILTMKYYCMI